MKIIVCVKQVPDTATKIKVGTDAKTIDSSGIEYVISPYDELAVEHAVQIKENNDDIEIVAVTMGTTDSDKILRHALAMGADRGILIESDVNCDSFCTAQALANAIKEENADLVLCGVKAVDDDCSQVGGILATLLDMPFIWSAAELDYEENKVTAQNELAGETYTIECELPCLVSIQKGSIEARINSLISIRKARKKEVQNVSPTLSDAVIQTEKLELPAAKVGGRIVGEGPEAVTELFKLLREESKVL
ncbi:electron transfer flavoprotein beta subunit/FixA family protein [Candidatus Uabimicrobium sp. HlEnr_7]|uniref:electron transfer flavoprotein subunit beta/FixA family protein n=1 Tax=Candidatus Uabimicrobium helgolandensis TaxID=3095367 RepID=UPI003558B572